MALSLSKANLTKPQTRKLLLSPEPSNEIQRCEYSMKALDEHFLMVVFTFWFLSISNSISKSISFYHISFDNICKRIFFGVWKCNKHPFSCFIFHVATSRSFHICKNVTQAVFISFECSCSAEAFTFHACDQ